MLEVQLVLEVSLELKIVIVLELTLHLEVIVVFEFKLKLGLTVDLEFASVLDITFDLEVLVDLKLLSVLDLAFNLKLEIVLELKLSLEFWSDFSLMSHLELTISVSVSVSLFETTMLTMVKVAMAVCGNSFTVSASVAINGALISGLVVVLRLVEIVTVDGTLINGLIDIVGSVLVDTVAGVNVVRKGISKIGRVVLVVDSVVVDISGAVTLGVAEASNGANLNVFLTEIALVAVGARDAKSVSANGTKVTSAVLEATGWAGRATVAAVSGSTVGWAGTVVATASETTVTLGTLRSS